MVRFRAAAPDQLRMLPLDALTLAYHRPAGATHLLAEPAPEILAALQAAPSDLAALVEKFELADADVPALAERIDELIAAGLVERV